MAGFLYLMIENPENCARAAKYAALIYLSAVARELAPAESTLCPVFVAHLGAKQTKSSRKQSQAAAASSPVPFLQPLVTPLVLLWPVLT